MAHVNTSTQRSSAGTSVERGYQWRDNAACLEFGPGMFEHTDGQGATDRRHQDEAAARICAGCPVRELCAKDGEHERFGVRGGKCMECSRLTDEGRIKRSPVPRDECGTPAGHSLHQNAGERVCVRCSNARARAKREAFTAERARAVTELVERRKAHHARKSTEAAVEVYASPHGTAEGRKNLGILIESIKEKK